MKEPMENKTINVCFPMPLKKILVLWKYSRFILGQLMKLSNCSQNTLNLRNCRLMKMDLEAVRMFTSPHLYLALKPSLKSVEFAEVRAKYTASYAILLP